MSKEEIKKLDNKNLVAQLISHAHTFGDFVKETEEFAEEILCRLEPLVMPNEVVAGGSCLWSKEDEDNNSYYETGCGNAFECMNGDYQHNHFTHCPFCGKPIEENDSQREA